MEQLIHFLLAYNGTTLTQQCTLSTSMSVKKWQRFMEQPSHFLLGCSGQMSNADVNLSHHMKSLLRNGAAVLWSASDIILSYHALANQAEI